MIWLLAANRDGTLSNNTDWAARIAEVKAHRENLTAISPCIYCIGADGSFARKPNVKGRVDIYDQIFPHIQEFAEMGLNVYPLIAGPPNVEGQAALTRNPQAFIKAAVAEAARGSGRASRRHLCDPSWRERLVHAGR